MNSQVVALAMLSGVALAAVAVSFFATFRTKVMNAAAAERIRAAQTQFETGIQILRETVDGLAAQVRDLQQGIQEQACATVSPGVPKPGMNLSKRSQALRMNRRGDTPEQIAAA